jgi:hypothetical protein
MGVLNTYNFNDGTTGDMVDDSPTGSGLGLVSSSLVYEGANALRQWDFDSSGFVVNGARTPTYSPFKARIYGRGAFYYKGFDDYLGANESATGVHCQMDGAAPLYHYDGNTVDSKLHLYRDTTNLVTGTAVLSLNTWYIWLFQCFAAGVSTVIELKLYNSTGTSLLDTLTYNGNDTTLNVQYVSFQGGAWNTAGKGCYWDWIEIRDDAYPSTIPPAPNFFVKTAVRPRPFAPGRAR